MTNLAAFGLGIVAGAVGSFVFVFAFQADRLTRPSEVDVLRNEIDGTRSELHAALRG